MTKKLMLLAAVICGFSFSAVAQPAAPTGSADQKPAAEQKMEKTSTKKAKKPAKKGKKIAKGKTEKKAEAPAAAPAAAPATK